LRNLMMVFGIFSAIILFFLIYPFISLIFLTDAESLGLTLSSGAVIKALLLTLEAATISTLILMVFGVPLAYVLARFEFRGKKLVEAITDLPLVVPHAVVGIIILIAFGPRSCFAPLLEEIGMVMEDSFWAIVAVFCFVGTPLLVDCAKDGFASINPYLEGVARCMGAGPGRTFYTIALPLALRSILTGALLAWARAMSEVGALLIIAYYPKTINVLVIEWFSVYGLRYTVALTLILLSISIVVFVVLRWILGWKH